MRTAFPLFLLTVASAVALAIRPSQAAAPASMTANPPLSCNSCSIPVTVEAGTTVVLGIYATLEEAQAAQDDDAWLTGQMLAVFDGYVSNIKCSWCFGPSWGVRCAKTTGYSASEEGQEIWTYISSDYEGEPPFYLKLEFNKPVSIWACCGDC